MNRRSSRLQPGNEEGAAVVEFALVTLLLVPLMLYAIYAGEAFLAAAKAQEAEISAGWDVSAYRLHDYSGGDYKGLYSAASSRSASKVKDDLKDFDSYSERSSSGWKQVTSRSTLKELTCGLRGGSGGGPAVYSGGLPAQLHNDGYVGCEARITFENTFLPQKLHQEFIKLDLLPNSISKFEMCGLGSTVQGCKGDKARGFVLLTDDWGLENGTQNPVGKEANREYFAVGKAVYRGGGGAAAVLAVMGDLLGTGDHGQTSTFKMGYLSAVSTRRSVPMDSGRVDPHLSPWDEEASDDTGNVAEISRKVYGERRNDQYLGKQDRNFNLP